MDTSPDEARTTLLKPASNVGAGDNNMDTSNSHLSIHLSCPTCSSPDHCAERSRNGCC